MQTKASISGVLLTCVALAFFITLFYGKIFTHAQSAVQVTLEVPSQVAPNSDFTVKVNVSQVTFFDAASYNVSFDSALLRLNNVTSGQIGSTSVPVDIWNPKNPGLHVIVQNIPRLSGVSGSGYLAVLHFSNISPQNRTAVISLSNGTLGDNMAQAIPATWNGASLNVTGSQPTVPTVPAAPTSARTIAITTSQVTLLWTDNANNETGFTIQRATDSAFIQNLAAFTVAANTAIYTDTGIVPATIYYYRVSAYNTAGNSGSSETVAVAIPSVTSSSASSSLPSSTPATSTPQVAAPAPAVSAASVSAMIDTGGRFKQDVVIETVPAKARLTISRDTVALTREKTPPVQITISEAVRQPSAPAGSRTVGKVYDFGPGGVNFDPPIRITLSYTPADIPAGFSEKELGIGYWNAETGIYTALQNCIVDQVSHTVSAPVKHFTAFAIVAQPARETTAAPPSTQPVSASAPATTPSSQTPIPFSVIAPPVPSLSPSPVPPAQGPASSPPASASETESKAVNWPVLGAIGGVATALLLVILIKARSRY